MSKSTSPNLTTPSILSATATGLIAHTYIRVRGEQTGKRDAEERNDPAVQPGAREGKPDPEGEAPRTPGR